MASAAEAGDGLVPVPAFGGLGAPYWDRGARAVLVGMTQATGPAELARASALGAAGLAAGQWTRRDLETAGNGGTVFQPRAGEPWRARRPAEWHDALARAASLAANSSRRRNAV